MNGKVHYWIVCDAILYINDHGTALRHMEKAPFDSDLSAQFGTGTYRLPSLEECDTPEIFQQYINRLDVHTYRAHLFELTKAIAH